MFRRFTRAFTRSLTVKFLGRHQRMRCSQCGAVKVWAQLERFAGLTGLLTNKFRWVCFDTARCERRAARKRLRRSRYIAHVEEMRRRKAERRRGAFAA